MTNLSDKKILVIDYGNNIGFAMKMAQTFGSVFYWAGPYVTNSFPVHNPLDIGNNVPNLIKVKEWAEAYYEVDTVVFCDSMEPYLQELMRTEGKAVFGCGFADRLEHDRLYIKETLKSLGLPVGAYYKATGLDDLEQVLMGAKNVYVKHELRGNSETWLHKNWQLTKKRFTRMRYEMGLYENRETYVVEEMLDALAEVGMDGFICDGEWAPICTAGCEIKDAGYLARVVRYQHLPSQIKDVTDKLAPIFKSLNYNGHHSNEVIITKDKRGFALDLTNRIPSPPGDLMAKIFTNYAEIIWDVAHKRMPVIQYEHEWGVQLILKSELAKTDPSPVLVPEEYKDNVKIKNLSIDEDGTWYYVPAFGFDMSEIGSVVFTADTMEDAIKGAKKIADSIEGFDVTVNIGCLDDAKKTLEKLKKNGINFI